MSTVTGSVVKCVDCGVRLTDAVLGCNQTVCPHHKTRLETRR